MDIMLAVHRRYTFVAVTCTVKSAATDDQSNSICSRF
jgi:hypothetical protein